MPVFSFQAYNKAGRVVTGDLVADDKEQVEGLVLARGLVVISVGGNSQKDVAWWNREIYTVRRSKSVPLAQFTRELASFLSAGLRTAESLQTIGEAQADTIGKFADELASRVLSGQTLSQALSSSGSAIPESYIAMIEAGEASGQLSEVLLVLADMLEQEDALKEKVRGALVYPCILLAAALGTILIAIIGVVPRLAPFLEGNTTDLPLPTRALLSLSSFNGGQWLVLLMLVITGLIALAALVRWPRYRLWFQSIRRRVPLVGPLLQTRQWARYCRMLGLMLQNNIGVVEAMRIAARMIPHEVERDILQEAAENVRSGAAFSEAINGAGRLPVSAVRLMTSGDKAGRLAEMTLNAAKRLEAEVETRTSRLTTILPTILTLIMGVLVALIIASVFSVILSVNEISA